MAKGTSLVRLEADTGSYERNMRQAQKTFDDFLRGIGVSVPKIGALTAAIGATAAAIKVAKDAFKSNEVTMDDWRRAIASAEGVYNGFLNALNTGDVSGYLSKDDAGKIKRGTWHDIEIVPNKLTRIEANLTAQVFVQSVGGGDY